MIQFDLKEQAYDVICVGGGGGGITAAVTAAQCGAKVGLISKEPIGFGNTRISGGGIAFDTAPQDFIDDIMISGQGLNRPELVRVLAEEAPDARKLLEEYGNIFRVTSSGEFEINRRGGHRKARSLKCAFNGRSLAQTLRAVTAKEKLTAYEEMIVVKVLIAEGSVCGLLAFDLIGGRFHWFHTPAVILATGGAGWLYYPHTNCVKSAVGDGFALALEAGAELMDMEQMQFLPFAVTYPLAYKGIYCGEPSNLAGPRGRLLDADGNILLENMDKRTRDEVANLLWREIMYGRPTKYGGLQLDISKNPENGARAIRKKVGAMYEVVRYAYGRKSYEGQKPLDVAPTAHHSLGGIVADEKGGTGVNGLFAIGEVRGGVHGANRLASVALTELFVFGKKAGQAAAAMESTVCPGSRAKTKLLLNNISDAMSRQKGPRPIELKEQLFDIMWKSLGGIRSGKYLQRGLVQLDKVRDSFQHCRVSSIQKYNTELFDYLELHLMMSTVEVMLVSALTRQETRGTHLREDYPEPDEEHGARSIVFKRRADELVYRWMVNEQRH
jgi:succinate dehydrogenase/fumarate reductase flavoprotein subunit